MLIASFAPQFVTRVGSRSNRADCPFQVFLNIVLDDAVEEKNGGEKVKLGMVVRATVTFLPTASDGEPG